MKTLIVLSSGMFFASCMHMGTLPAHSAGEHGEADGGLEKEVVSGNIRAVATFPPVEEGKELEFTLVLTNRTGERPLTGARVFFRAEPVRVEDGNAVGVTREAVEKSEEPGTYAVSYTPSRAGTESLLFCVVSVGNRQIEPALVVDGRRTVGDASPGHQAGMMDSGGSSTAYMIAGGMLMAAMMVMMIAR